MARPASSRRWPSGSGGEAARWPARAFAVVACGPLFTGTYPYAAGLAAGLGCAEGAPARPALDGDRLSPRSRWASRRSPSSTSAWPWWPRSWGAAALDRTALAVGGALLALGLVQGALLLLYPEEAEYPFFRLEELLAVIVLSAPAPRSRCGPSEGASSRRSSGSGPCGVVVAFTSPSPIGENVTRLRGIVLPLALLAAALAAYRPRWLAGVAVAGALAYTLVPYVGAALHRTDTRSAEEAFWEPALDFLAERRAPTTASRSSRPATTGRRTGCRGRASRSRAAGTASSTSPRTRSSTRSRSSPRPTAPGWTRSASARCSSRTRSSAGSGRSARPSSCARARGAGEVARAGDVTVYEVPDATPILTGPGRPG